MASPRKRAPAPGVHDGRRGLLEARPVPQPSASCLLLRRSFLPEGQIFDERYPIFFNDVQLARSFADQGLTLWVTPDAAVVHEGHASTRMMVAGNGSTLVRSFGCSTKRNRRPRCGSTGSSFSGISRGGWWATPVRSVSGTCGRRSPATSGHFPRHQGRCRPRALAGR